MLSSTKTQPAPAQRLGDPMHDTAVMPPNEKKDVVFGAHLFGAGVTEVVKDG
jgi:hypothetical protein